MSANESLKPVERLFPFALRSRILLIGRDNLRRSKNKLQFLLISTDLSENSRNEILSEFAPYAIVQNYTSAELKTHFQVEGTKVIGFQKSDLSSSIYAELKSFRINKPPVKETPPVKAARAKAAAEAAKQSAQPTPPAPAVPPEETP